MDDQYLDAFLRESEEAITALNNSLLDLESDPSDTEAMEDIFRRAHTLKGNFGAMGFDEAAKLAHAIEDLLDEMRQGEMDVTPDVMDLVFAGVDQIEAIVTAIEEEREANVDTGPIVAELRTVLKDGVEAIEDADDPADDAAADRADTGQTIAGEDRADEELPAIDPDGVDGRVVQATVGIGDSDMAGVDSMLALEGIEESLEILACSPERDDVESGEFEDTFVCYLAAPDPGSAASVLDDVSKVAEFSVTDVTDDVSAPEATGAPDEADASDHTVDEIKSVRVDVGQLDDLHGLVEQLVTSRIKLRRAIDKDDLSAAGETLNELDKITANLQNTVMDMRLIPLKKVVGKFPRLVRDLARELDKEVTFEISGEDIELDRTILTEISDPLMHILRNAVDHGIEPPDERESLGKPREGTIELRATRERDHVVIEVEDDGGGLDIERIREQAVQQGVRSADELEEMDDSEVYDLVFHPGFSTSEEVTDTSGRGVGMDVVHDTVTRLDGSVGVDSTPGSGTTVTVRLPVTMAIVKVLFVMVGDEQYGIPIKNIDEISQSDETERVDGQPVVEHDDEIYPVVHLADAFDVPDAKENGDGMLVRIRASERKVALQCDAVTQQEEVVVKPLEGVLTGTDGLSGTAVLGDGDIVHIIDVGTL
jgi:two-component system chemotaxis sensor kinase CheA